MAGTCLAEATGDFSRATFVTLTKIVMVPEEEVRKFNEQMVQPIQQDKAVLKKG